MSANKSSKAPTVNEDGEDEYDSQDAHSNDQEESEEDSEKEEKEQYLSKIIQNRQKMANTTACTSTPLPPPPDSLFQSSNTFSPRTVTEKEVERCLSSCGIMELFEVPHTNNLPIDISPTDSKTQKWEKLKQELKWHGGTDYSMSPEHYIIQAGEKLQLAKDIFNVRYFLITSH